MAADADDYAAVGKLRIIKFAKVLMSKTSKLEMVTLVLGQSVLDVVFLRDCR